MAGGGLGWLRPVVMLAILATISTSRVPAVEAEMCCATTTQDVVNYCHNVQTSKYFTATITCCIMAQNQPKECWCQIRRALGDDVLGPNCLRDTSC